MQYLHPLQMSLLILTCATCWPSYFNVLLQNGMVGTRFLSLLRRVLLGSSIRPLLLSRPISATGVKLWQHLSTLCIHHL